MIYPYRHSCGSTFEVIKSVKDIDRPEFCPNCPGNFDQAERYIARTHFYGAKVEDVQWNPGLGKFTRSAKHRAELAKRMDVIEIGNEAAESMHQREEKVMAERDAVNYEEQIKW